MQRIHDRGYSLQTWKRTINCLFICQNISPSHNLIHFIWQPAFSLRARKHCLSCYFAKPEQIINIISNNQNICFLIAPTIKVYTFILIGILLIQIDKRVTLLISLPYHWQNALRSISQGRNNLRCVILNQNVPRYFNCAKQGTYLLLQKRVCFRGLDSAFDTLSSYKTVKL